MPRGLDGKAVEFHELLVVLALRSSPSERVI